MIQLDPGKRSSIREHLENCRSTVFPDTFYSTLNPYISQHFEPTLIESPLGTGGRILIDEKLDILYDDFGQIMKEIHVDSRNENDAKLDVPAIFGSGVSALLRFDTLTAVTGGNELVVILSLVQTLARSVSLPSSRLKALDMFLKLSSRTSDQVRLERIVPYLMTFLADAEPRVRVLSLKVLTQTVWTRF